MGNGEGGRSISGGEESNTIGAPNHLNHSQLGAGM